MSLSKRSVLVRSLLITSFLLLPFSVEATNQVAFVKILKGTVESSALGKTILLKVKDTLPEGSMVKTGDKSFAQIELIDKSILNVGPNTEMKITSFTEDTGVIDFVKGKVRAQVTKQQSGDGSKMIIKTPVAVMGVRGTDFVVTGNEHATSSVLFEGEIVFNKLSDKSINDPRGLDNVLSQGVRIQPGEFSVMSAKLEMPTLPARLNVQQLEKLESNPTFESNEGGKGEGQDKEQGGSVVPKGLNGTVVANTESAVDSVVGEAPRANAGSSDAQGFSDGVNIKPANGSFVHLESGVVIPPPADAVFDANSNTFIAPSSSGTVSSDGSFVPPANVEITPKGDIIVTSTEGGTTVKREIASTAVIIGGSLTNATTASTAVSPAPTMPTMILPPPPSGGIQGVNDPQRTNGTYTDVIFRSR
jgi:hypothetical protein